LSQQQFEGSAKYAHFPPEQELVWEQHSWHDGFGQWLFDEPNFYFESKNVDLRFKDQATLASGLTTVTVKTGDTAFSDADCFPCVHTDGNLYVAVGRYIYQYDYTDEEFDEVKDLGSGTTCTHLVSYGANVYAACGASVKYYYGATTSWTQSTISDGYADKFAVVQTTLWKLLSNGECKSSTNPINGGSWSTANTVGETSDPGRNLLEILGRLIVLKESGGYSIDAAGTITQLFKAPATFLQNNYKCVHDYHNMAFLATGNEGLQIYNRGFLDSVHPRRWAPKSNDALGYVRGMTDDDEYLYVLLSDSPIIAGRLQNIGGQEDFAWHPLWYDATLRSEDNDLARALIIHRNAAADGTRLWIFFADLDGSTRKPGYIELPASGVNPQYDLGAAEVSFPTSGTNEFTTGYMDWGLAATPKAFYSVRLKTENLTANITVKVSYAIDDASSFTDLATWTSNTDTHQFFPASTTGKRIRLKFTLATNAATTTPALINFSLHAALRPKPKKVWDFVVNVDDYAQKYDGSSSSQLESWVATQLHTAATTTWPCTLWDRRGSSHTVTLLPGYPREIEVDDLEQGRFSSLFQLRMIEATTS
jgi:hypothetical protein